MEKRQIDDYRPFFSGRRAMAGLAMAGDDRVKKEGRGNQGRWSSNISLDCNVPCQ